MNSMSFPTPRAWEEQQSCYTRRLWNIWRRGAGANFFILPSSIHESILILDTGEMDAKELQAMVMSVNQTNVSPEERLSDEVYYYDREEHCLSMATGREATQELKEQLRQAGDNSMERPEELER